jgi:hypothetical protein
MKHSGTGISLKIDLSGPPVTVTFAPEIPLGTRNLRATINGRAIHAAIRSYKQDAHAEVEFSSQRNTEVVLSFEAGVRPWIHPTRLAIGDESHGLRILSSKLEGRTYSAHVEGRSKACTSLSITSPWRVKQVEGGKVSTHQEDEWTFIVSPRPEGCDTQPATPSSYGTYQDWTFRVEFEP